MCSEPHLDEAFAILIEDKDGNVEIDGVSYILPMCSVLNPTDDTEETLVKLIKSAHEAQQKDNRRRVLVRFKRKAIEGDKIKLVSVVPIGPVNEVMNRLENDELQQKSLHESLTPQGRAVLIDSIAPEFAGSDS